VYGGADAERAIDDDAVAATAGQVLLYGGRVVNAPYHSTCGGSTAEPAEVWYRAPGEPYLQRVSDQIPGTDRYYCDPSPRFLWTRSFDRATLAAALARYLGDYAPVRRGRTGAVRDVWVRELTPSGRVRTLVIDAERGHYALRGNDIRFVLRPPGGEILNSTYFSVESSTGADGRLATLTLRGRGYGHGVGMCQWGAIGRARAGQDYRTILQTYYPGTIVGTVD
jgi:stage II sporulation protein D